MLFDLKLPTPKLKEDKRHPTTTLFIGNVASLGRFRGDSGALVHYYCSLSYRFFLAPAEKPIHFAIIAIQCANRPLVDYARDIRLFKCIGFVIAIWKVLFGKPGDARYVDPTRVCR